MYDRLVLPMDFISSVKVTLRLFLKHPKYFNRIKYLKSVLTSFHVISNWDDMTNEVKRNFLAYHTANSDYPVPDGVMLQKEFRRITSQVLAGTCYLSLSRLRVWFEDLKQTLPIFVREKEGQSID